MTIVYLVRHGQASFGSENYDQLSATGVLQAKALGQYISPILKQQPYVVAGNMKRHQQTAQFTLESVVPNFDLKTREAWNEFNHQEVFEKYDPNLLKAELLQVNQPRDYLSQVFTHAMARWAMGNFDGEYTETWTAFQQRVLGALAWLERDLTNIQPSSALIFTSGGVIATIVAHLLDLPLEKTLALSFAISNCSLTSLRIEAGRIELLSFNEHQYLNTQDKSLLTWL